MSEGQFYVEVNVVQKNHDQERICGDKFLHNAYTRKTES